MSFTLLRAAAVVTHIANRTKLSLRKKISLAVIDLLAVTPLRAAGIFQLIRRWTYLSIGMNLNLFYEMRLLLL